MTETVTTERLATVHWSEALSLDLDFMDDTHREFIDLLAAIEVAMSNRIGGSLSPGTAKAIGLVPSSRSKPPHGAMKLFEPTAR